MCNLVICGNVFMACVSRGVRTRYVSHRWCAVLTSYQDGGGGIAHLPGLYRASVARASVRAEGAAYI